MLAVKPDTGYRIEDFTLFNDRQTDFYLHRTEMAMFHAVQRLNGKGGGRLLDVACGLGTQVARLALRGGWEAYGVDASDEMLRLGQFRYPGVHKRVRLARGIAEALPFRSGYFDVVMCQGAMDHFADRQRFVEEVERVLTPGGHLVVALANYESLSCRVGKFMDDLSRTLGVDTPSRYQFWRIPKDHTFRGSYRLLMGLANGELKVAKMHGASMFLFLPPWRELLEAMPYKMAAATFRVVDRVAYRLPASADVVIAAFEKEDLSGLLKLRQEARGNGKKRSTSVPAYLLRR